MFLGAFGFWVLEKTLKNPQGRIYRIGVENQETICAGAIAGGSLVGIILIGLNASGYF
jgi:hypothetical protein